LYFLLRTSYFVLITELLDYNDRTVNVRQLRLFFLLVFTAGLLSAQNLPESAYSALQWRLIGPFRAGRVSAVAGVPTDPATYYIGAPGGGVWKTSDAGRVWKPISDDVKVASIGAVAVSESNPNIVYFGTGEQTQGNGVYKSNDAGAHWTHIGLEQTHYITSVIVDRKNPDVVWVAALGDKQSGDARGVFKSIDGGKTWKKVLFKDEHAGVADLNQSPDDPEVFYAALWTRPEESPREQSKTQDAVIYKSTDGGETWAPIGGQGLPTEEMGRVGIAAAPGGHGKTVYAIATQGFFRSDDGGATWRQTTKDPRVVGNWYFSRVFVDPKNPDLTYVAQTSMYRSRDGGKTFEAWTGAPSGDDFHLIWINPADTRFMLLGVDQGAVISVNGGATWSSWYNQPTGQFYHVSTDNHFPYYVYAAQQDSGTAAVASRSDYGEITARDWAPTGGFEFAFIAPDPVNPNWVYTGGWYGSVLRYDKVTGQVTHVFVRTEKYRTANMAPIAFSPQDPHTMYVGAQYVLRTNDGGMHWQEISPDLTVKPAPQKSKTAASSNKADITTLAPSTIQAEVMWAGTSNGLIQLTRDGNTWQNVTPKGLPKRSTVNAIEASRHDAAEAYAVIDARDDLHPYAYRTQDYGQTWTPITTGMKDGVIARIVREDLLRKGLLFAGTEDAAYVSFDDGDHWQSFQQNMPTTPVRDLEVHGDDLVAATYGRSLWILDNITPLRQLSAQALSESALLKPAQAVRTRWDVNQDTPWPIETPAAKNPPDGAIIDYWLPKEASGEVKLAVYDAEGQLVREYSSTATEPAYPPANVPDYWFARFSALPKKAGLNRFVWDLRYAPPKTLSYSYYGNHLDYVEYTLMEHAIPGETPRDLPMGSLVLPGDYTLALTVEGKTYKQPLHITLDPRVKATQADLSAQMASERELSAMMTASYDGYNDVTALQNAIAERQKSATGALAQSLKMLAEQASKLANGEKEDLGFGPVNRESARLMEMVSSGDALPASGLVSGVELMCRQLQHRAGEWQQIQLQRPAINTQLQAQGLAMLPMSKSAAVTCQ
jgi:photosystem II stability/assembly factor-like uncharacterized protein